MSVEHIPQWAVSRKGAPIELYHSADTQALQTSRPILLMGGIHGDEPEGVALARATLAWLTSQVKAKSKTIAVPWILIPCLNVDGFAMGQRVNGAGVDLNRNYPAQSWSTEHTQAKYYPGPSPASEPEIQSVVALVQKYHPRLIIHCHSWNPCVVYTGEWAKTDGQYLSEASGYDLVESIGYPTPGSLSQYGWHDLKIPIICIEEQEGAPLDSVWSHFAKGIERIFADASERRGSP